MGGTRRGAGTAAARMNTALLGLLVAALLALSLLLARPAHAITLTVNSTADPGTGGCNSAECTLREAINTSNGLPTTEIVNIDIPATDPNCNATTGVCTITPATQLPSMTDNATINGYTQGDGSASTTDDATENTSTTNTNNAALKVEINGAAASAPPILTPGLTVSGTGASGTAIRGLVINRFSLHGIFVDAGATATVEGCFIGTDPTGETDLGNGFDGVLATSSNNRIGGAADAAQNVISGNGRDGVALGGTGATGNAVVNNHIGTDADAIDALGNIRHGMFTVASGTTIGGNDANTGNGAGQENGEGNIISGNGQHGILVDNIFAEGTRIQGNHVGVDRNGSGDDLGNGLVGVRVSSAPGVEIGGTVDGLGNTISGNGQHGVEVVGTSSTSVRVRGNRIGTNYIGRSDLGNGGDGVRLGNVSGAGIGGTTAASRNLISGNDANGVFIFGTSSATNNRVEGNRIGSDVGGTTDLGNAGAGVRVETPDNVIGGSIAASNLVSGNTGAGVALSGTGASGNTVSGNTIGTEADGESPLPNLHGVLISGASGNDIGANLSPNTISGNANDGVKIVGPEATGNRVLNNSIFENGSPGGLGIELNDDGVSANDPRDADTGPNNLQNFPTITAAATSGVTRIRGTLDSTPNQTFTVQLYSNPAPNIPTGFGEGRSFVGEIGATTNASGLATFTFTSQFGIPAGRLITATATSNATGDTSEFSAAVEVTEPLVVNSAGDAGDALLADTPSVCDADLNTPGLQCTLRAAIQEANTGFGSADTVEFAIPGSGVRTISPASALPTVTQPLVIDGYSQPGASQNTLAVGTNAALRVQISGVNAATSTGLNVDTSGSLVTGLAINRFARGIQLAGSNNRVEGNFVGTNAPGTVDLGNTQQGVAVAGSDGNEIGGITPGARNLISGNGGSGITVGAGSAGTTIEGNLIGPNATGTGDLGNSGSGILLSGASSSTLGGTTPGAANAIAFNGRDGVTVRNVAGSPATANRILRNSIFSNGGLGIDLNDDGPTANDPGDPDAGPNLRQNKPVLTSATTTRIRGSLNSTPGQTFTIQFFRNPSGDEGKVFVGQRNVTTNANGNVTFSFDPAVSLPAGQTVTATATGAGNTSEFSAPRAVGS